MFKFLERRKQQKRVAALHQELKRLIHERNSYWIEDMRQFPALYNEYMTVWVGYRPELMDIWNSVMEQLASGRLPIPDIDSLPPELYRDYSDTLDIFISVRVPFAMQQAIDAAAFAYLKASGAPGFDEVAAHE